ncbi:hypothetical protein AX774_g4430 [Zancudomyces culisetae]|uniref:Uncharacterized protein n=1 Tax=Zancudomyces culisetae TaxID=1213189 RepID=A0A1R1PMB6_ZANCU|nr:hypothetical protein AX774_g4430 [Zancudomyces culisetae]|eukprot:OMH82104.1 hypothetical protein AX774_g4430 [Zancudomyces culisetae]
MSGLMGHLRAAIIQRFKDEGRYSSDSDRSEATSMEIEPEGSRDPFSFLEGVVQREMDSMRNPTKERGQSSHVRHYQYSHIIPIRQCVFSEFQDL